MIVDIDSVKPANVKKRGGMMFFKKIFMDQTGSLSYIFGCTETKSACIIDPQKSIHEYLNTAQTNSMSITHIFETPQNSMHPSGGIELSLRTRAKLYFLNEDDCIINGSVAKEGERFFFGNMRMEIINSPMHNPFANSILITDISKKSEQPWLIPTRACLFAGNITQPNIEGKELANEVTKYLDFHKPISNLTSPTSMPNEYFGMKNCSDPVLSQSA